MNKKIMIYFFIVFLIVSFVVWAESYRRTAADLYQDSYAAQMRKQMGYSDANDIRAEQYRTLYEQYDAQHNPVKPAGPPNGGSVEEKTKAESQAQTVKPFLHVPIWQ